MVYVYMCCRVVGAICCAPLSFAEAVALDPAEEEGLVVLEQELGPVVGELVVAVKGPPDDLVVPGALAGAAQREVHAVHVLWRRALGFDVQVALPPARGINRRLSFLAFTLSGFFFLFFLQGGAQAPSAL